MKRFLIALFLFGFLLFPFVGFADCNKDGATVIFINGIFGSEEAATKDKKLLEDTFFKYTQDKNVKFINGFNPSHIGKIGDLIKVVMQAYGNQDLDFDLTTILNQIHSKLETKKILLVGHSQGTFYTNSAYEYLVKNGIAPESITVYNIATPANYVAGNGSYLTSDTDKVIESIVRELAQISSAQKPLEANISIELSDKEQADPFGGHSFSEVYLNTVPDRIIGDIYTFLGNLSVSNNNFSGECFKEPGEGLAYKMQKLGLGFLDSGFKTASNLDANDFLTTSEETLAKLFNWGKGIVAYISQSFKNGGLFQAALGQLQKTEANNGQEDEPFFNEQDNNYSNIATEENEQNDDFTGIGGPDMELATEQELQDLLDEIEEKLDVINQQILELQDQNKKNQTEEDQENTDNEQEEDDQQSDLQEEIENTESQETTDTTTNTTTTGGGTSINYPKILISEVQVGAVSDSKEEFVELYNPNSESVDLTKWYLQRKTKTGSGYMTYASKNLFAGKQILSKNYFLISRCGYFEALSDICVENSISNDNSFILKNPSGEESDKLGIGDAQEYEGLPAQNPLQGKSQTIGRKIKEDGSEQESNNNFFDFELQNPTPKMENAVFAENIIPKKPDLKKVLINEIQIAGAEDEKEEFVELYNPNDEDINLSGWYLQKKTAGSEDYSTYAPKTLFENKIIKAKSYFLISREGYFEEKADIFVDKPLTEDNTLVLKRQDRSISDKVGWQNATDFETAPACSFDIKESIERKIIGKDTDNNFDDFRISNTPSPGESFINAKIEDATDYAGSFKCDNGCFYDLYLTWGSLVQDLDFFQLQYKLNDGDWQDWIQKTTETSANFKGFYSLIEERNIYSFRVKVQDTHKNESEWQEINIDLSVPVVINEVALFGTVAGNSDNWVELYNRSENDIDLTGWQITFDGGNILLSGKIPAKGFYIIEKDDDDVLDVPADNIFGGGFSGKFFYLKDSKNRRVDEVYDNGDWNYGNMDQKHFSLERISPYSFGFVKENWKLNDSKKMNGTDRDGNPIYGTPGNENSYFQLYTLLPLEFGRDIVLPENLSPYAFLQNTKVIEGVKLTIAPGIVLKALNPLSKIIINGTLFAVGGAEEKIVFTSVFDDEFGGDTNNDCSETVPKPGGWFGIEFNKESANSEIDYVVFRYGGASFLDFGAVMRVNQASVKIKNSIFENNLNRGLFLINSSSEIESSRFLNIKESDPNTGFNAVGISVLGGADIIKDCYFSENNYGISVEDWSDNQGGVFNSEVLVQNNNFEKNKIPIYTGTFKNPVFEGNNALENNYNAIVFSKNIMAGDLTLKPDLPYLADGLFFVPENAILTLEPGVVMDLSGMNINGTLKAIGTQENPIIFRDYYWDQEWAQRPGKWHGLRFSETSKESELENIEIFFAGSNSLEGYEFEGAIRAENCDISLKNSYLYDNQNSGLYLINAEAIVDTVVFKNHTESGYPGASASAIHIKAGKTEVKNSYFENQIYGIYLEKWTDSEGVEIFPDANLHTDPEDPEKNIFQDTTTAGGDIFDATLP